MLSRHALTTIEHRLARFPAVVLLGSRQVGKTTLARLLAARQPGTLMLDLERESDRAQLAQPELFFARHRERLVVLDEVQALPGLFAALRPEIDADRRPGRFLLLGSASGRLLRQSAESLAGRVSYLELPPLSAAEVLGDRADDLGGLQRLWLRGGYPESLLALDDATSLQWRQDLILTLLQRDLQQLGVTVPAETLHRFWRMLAHLQGQLFNASALGASLGGQSHTTVARHLDLLVDALWVRRLAPHLPNIGKRLVRSPKVYVRDSGLLHALLGLREAADLQGHPIAGASWEGFVVEQLAAHAPNGSSMGFYRTAVGAELDIVLDSGRRRIGIEIKFSSAPKPARGFWQAIEDCGVDRAYVVAPVRQGWPLAQDVEVIPVTALPEACAG